MSNVNDHEKHRYQYTEIDFMGCLLVCGPLTAPGYWRKIDKWFAKNYPHRVGPLLPATLENEFSRQFVRWQQKHCLTPATTKYHKECRL